MDLAAFPVDGCLDFELFGNEAYCRKNIVLEVHDEQKNNVRTNVDNVLYVLTKLRSSSPPLYLALPVRSSMR